MKAKTKDAYVRRRQLVFISIWIAFACLLSRAIYLQLVEADFLQQAGANRHVKVIGVPAHRGQIVDRNQELLAVSTPVYSVWADPREALQNAEAIAAVAKHLKISKQKLRKRISERKDRHFMYVKRHVSPAQAESLNQFASSGFHLQREYRRYYPTGEIAGQVVGLTNIDDKGLEGMELAYDEWLRGVAGKKRVMRDGVGTIIADVEMVKAPRHGNDLQLSLDKRIQYLAYRELKSAIQTHRAVSGSVVVLNVGNGEVLAMANWPSFNPNNRARAKYANIRNRAVTDVFEPGSTMKPFVVAAAMEAGSFSASSSINTGPGYYDVNELRVRDMKNHGVLNLANILLHSSNVGVVKVSLNTPKEKVWDTYQSAGFGHVTGSGFPGEVGGQLRNFTDWSEVERATLAYGYGMSVTALQLARAYSVLANDGVLMPASFVKTKAGSARGERVISARNAQRVRKMLKAVVSEKGTGKLASVDGYAIAGKTGTAYKTAKGGYADDQYFSSFVGIAPADQPRIIVVVVIDQPRGEQHYGGEVAAPTFARITEGTLRLLNVPPNVTTTNSSLLLTQGNM